MRPQQNPSKGFTILELLVAAGITVVIVVMLGLMFGSLTKTSSRASQRIDAFRDARAALQMMERDIANLVRTQWQPDPFSIPPPASTQPVTRPSAYFALKNIYADRAAGNQQLYALIAAKNSGPGDVCSVGYYCRWNDQGYGYSLRRYFRDSTATFTALSSTPAYVPDTVLYTPDALGTVPNSMKDDLLAAHVWNLKVAAYDAAGNQIVTYPYICDPSATSPNPLPTALEISFKAMSAEAARTVIAVQAGASVWMDENDTTYQRLIKPNAYEFRARIKL